MAAARRRLRVGIIGAGEFAADCHIPGIQSHPDAEVVALCGRRFQETRALADRFQVPDVHTDYRELCRRSDIDAVTIVTPDIFTAIRPSVALPTANTSSVKNRSR